MANNITIKKKIKNLKTSNAAAQFDSKGCAKEMLGSTIITWGAKDGLHREY